LLAKWVVPSLLEEKAVVHKEDEGVRVNYAVLKLLEFPLLH
jgi:hypothetical protein